MGRCESVNVSIGFRVEISKIIQLLCEENYEDVNALMLTGVIEDNNYTLNSNYQCVLEELDSHKSSYKKNEITITEFRDVFIKYLVSNSLYESYLLIPTDELLQTERWGYNREGLNAASVDIDHVKSILKKKISGKFGILSNFPIVFFVQQHSG